MSTLYNKNHSFVFDKDLNPGKGEILNIKKIKNGYEIDVVCQSDGIFVLNSFYNPYWKVFINNQDSEIINLSEVHLGVNLTKGKNKIKFLYSRELLRKKISKFFFKN